jgi:glutamate dehydrogenase (NADP+)
MQILKSVFDQVVARNPNEPEFHQAVMEVLESLEPVAVKHPEWVAAGIFDRIVEPERQIIFRVTWIDDQGKSVLTRVVCVYTLQSISVLSNSSDLSRF